MSAEQPARDCSLRSYETKRRGCGKSVGRYDWTRPASEVLAVVSHENENGGSGFKGVVWDMEVTGKELDEGANIAPKKDSDGGEGVQRGRLS